MPGVTSNESVLHMQRSRRQKGSTHPASASAEFVLLPCSGVRLWVTERGGHPPPGNLLLAANLQSLSMAIHWVVIWPSTGKTGSFLPPGLPWLPVKYLFLCVGCRVPICTQHKLGSCSAWEGICGFFHPALCNLLTFFSFFFFLMSGPEILSKKDNSEALSSEH